MNYKNYFIINTITLLRRRKNYVPLVSIFETCCSLKKNEDNSMIWIFEINMYTSSSIYVSQLKIVYKLLKFAHNLIGRYTWRY